MIFTPDQWLTLAAVIAIPLALGWALTEGVTRTYAGRRAARHAQFQATMAALGDDDEANN